MAICEGDRSCSGELASLSSVNNAISCCSGLREPSTELHKHAKQNKMKGVKVRLFAIEQVRGSNTPKKTAGVVKYGYH